MGGICSVCCARERMIEIRCPESCEFLASGRLSAIERERQIRAKESPADGSRNRPVTERQEVIILTIEWAIVRFQREFYSGLTDADVLAGVNNAIRNLETESSGLIYEHKEYSSYADELSKRVRAELEEFAQKYETVERIATEDRIDALNFINDLLKIHMHRNDPRSYVRHIVQFFPWSVEEPQIVFP